MPTLRFFITLTLGICYGSVLSGCQSISSGATYLTSLAGFDRTDIDDIPAWTALDTGTLKRVSGHDGEVLTLRETNTSPDQLVTIGGDGAGIVWNLESGDGYRFLEMGEKPLLASLGAAHQLVAYTTENDVRVLSWGEKRHTWILSRLRTRARAIALHNNDTALLIGGADGRVYVWRFLDDENAFTADVQQKTLERYVAHPSVVTAIASHPFGRAFFSGDWQGGLYAWLPYEADQAQFDKSQNYFGARPFTAPQTFTRGKRTADRGIVSMALSGDGERLMLGTEDGFVELWEVKGFTMAARNQPHQGRVFAVTTDQTGNLVASAGRDGKVQLQQVEADPDYRNSPDAKPFKFKSLVTYPLEDVHALEFISKNRVIAATASGHVAEIAVPAVDKKPSITALSPEATGTLPPEEKAEDQRNELVDPDY